MSLHWQAFQFNSFCYWAFLNILSAPLPINHRLRVWRETCFAYFFFSFRSGSRRCDFTSVWTPLSETQIQFKMWAQTIYKIPLALLYFCKKTANLALVLSSSRLCRFWFSGTALISSYLGSFGLGFLGTCQDSLEARGRWKQQAGLAGVPWRLGFSGRECCCCWTQGSCFVSGSMSVVDSAVMAGVRPPAPRGAPNVSVHVPSAPAVRMRVGIP